MKNKGGRTRTRRTSAAKLLETPSPEASTAEKSPKSAILTDSSKRRKKTIAIATSTSALFKSPSHIPPKTSGSITDLKDMASSRLDDLKRHVDHSHSEIVKDLDAFQTRLQKRFKVCLSISLCLSFHIDRLFMGKQSSETINYNVLDILLFLEFRF